MTLKKLKRIAKETGRLPVERMPRIGVRGRSAEGYVGRPAGVQPKPPKFDEDDLQQSFSDS